MPYKVVNGRLQSYSTPTAFNKGRQNKKLDNMNEKSVAQGFVLHATKGYRPQSMVNVEVQRLVQMMKVNYGLKGLRLVKKAISEARLQDDVMRQASDFVSVIHKGKPNKRNKLARGNPQLSYTLYG